jgi:hypothetical protein
MSRTDWRSPGGYEDLRSLDAPGLAWEYLRRNPDFARERAKLARAARRGTLNPATADEFARHWGVRFRECRRLDACKPHSMDCPGVAECHRAGRLCRKSRNT